MEISQKDKLRYREPDPDFNEEHNRDVIADTIKKTDANHKRKAKMWDEGIRERADAVYSYIRHTASGGKSDKTIDQYLGKENMMRLLGQERLRELKMRANIPNLSKLKSN
jgi:hypothetical protein